VFGHPRIGHDIFIIGNKVLLKLRILHPFAREHQMARFLLSFGLILVPPPA
jgi:hypothetical protein